MTETRKMFIEGVYRVVENPNDKTAGIEILGGQFDGLVYQYGKVQMETGRPHLNFQRTIRRVPHEQDAREEVTCVAERRRRERGESVWVVRTRAR